MKSTDILAPCHSGSAIPPPPAWRGRQCGDCNQFLISNVDRQPGLGGGDPRRLKPDNARLLGWDQHFSHVVKLDERGACFHLAKVWPVLAQGT